MKNKIVLTTVYGRRILYHFSDDKLAHIQVIEKETEYPLGTIVIGKVKKMIPSSNACFVNIGNNIDYFLTIPPSLSDIIFTDHRKHKKLQCEDEILVQIYAEAVKLKQPKVTTDISISGRYTVAGRGQGITYSKKINKSDRKKIVFPEDIVSLANKCGIIIRTEAAAANDMNEVTEDILSVSSQYCNAVSKAFTSKCFNIMYKPNGIIENLIDSWIKYAPADFITDDTEYQDALIQVSKRNESSTYTFYDDETLALKKLYKLESTTDQVIDKKYYLKSGAFLLIEQGETLTAIDVNSGHATKGAKDEAVFNINMEAAEEIANLLSIRNISGMILIDFINMKNPKYEAELIDYTKKLLARDNISCRYIDMTGLGLMEIIRARKYKSFIEQWKKNDSKFN